MSLTNRQYEFIRRRYDEKQLRHNRELKEKEAAAYAAFPRLSGIDSELASLYARKARLMIGTAHASVPASGTPKSTDADIDEEIDDLQLERRALLAAAGFKNGEIEPDYDCPFCKDTGYVDGKKCSCFRQAETELLYDVSNLRDILKEENFGTFSLDKYSDSIKDPDTGLSAREAAARARDHALEYAGSFFEKYGNLCFSGKTGVGKTFLAHCIAKAVMDAGGSVLFMSAQNLISAFEDNQFRASDETRQTVQLIFSCDLLIIDDLAASINNSFVAASLLRCLDERHERQKGTVITTNLSLSELQSTYSDRILSRIYGNFKWIYMFGNDIRMSK